VRTISAIIFLCRKGLSTYGGEKSELGQVCLVCKSGLAITKMRSRKGMKDGKGDSCLLFKKRKYKRDG